MMLVCFSLVIRTIPGRLRYSQLNEISLFFAGPSFSCFFGIRLSVDHLIVELFDSLNSLCIVDPSGLHGAPFDERSLPGCNSHRVVDFIDMILLSEYLRQGQCGWLYYPRIVHIDINTRPPIPIQPKRPQEKTTRLRHYKKQSIDQFPQHHNKMPHQPQSSKTANSDILLRRAASARNFEGNGAAAFISLLLGQLPLLPPAGQASLRLPCNLFALSCNPLRRSLSSIGGKHLPLLAAGSLLDNRLWHKLHCSIDLSLRVMLLCAVELGSGSRRLDMGPMSFPCWQARAREERRRWA